MRTLHTPARIHGRIMMAVGAWGPFLQQRRLIRLLRRVSRQRRAFDDPADYEKMVREILDLIAAANLRMADIVIRIFLIRRRRREDEELLHNLRSSHWRPPGYRDPRSIARATKPTPQPSADPHAAHAPPTPVQLFPPIVNRILEAAA